MYVVFKCFMLQLFSCFRCMFKKSWGHGSGVRGRGMASEGQRMGRMTRLGSCGRDVLVLIPFPRPRPRERDEGSGEGATGVEWGEQEWGRMRPCSSERCSGKRGQAGRWSKPGSRDDVFWWTVLLGRSVGVCLGYRPMESYPIKRLRASNSLTICPLG
jgi:hypothetical protein